MMRRSSHAGLMLCATALGCGGCAVDEAAEVAEYRTVLGEAPVPAATSMEPLTVQESMRLASVFNEALDIEGEEYVQALIERRRAAAAFLPTIALAPSYQFREGTPTGVAADFDVPATLTMEFNPVSDREAIAAREMEIMQRRALLRDAQDALLLDTARAHYEALRAERAVEVIRNSLAVQNERVNDARGRLEAGVVSPLDLSLSEAQAAQTAVDLLSATNQLRIARRVLSFLTVSDAEHRPLADSLEVPGELPSLEAMCERAAGARQDLLAADRAIDVAAAEVREAYGRYFPSISLDLQVFMHRESDPESLDWAGLIRLSLPLFSAGLIEADVRDALSRLRQARSARSLLWRAIRHDIEIAAGNLEDATRRVDQLRIQVSSAAAALEQAEGLYEVGLATNLERLAAQQQLLSAELQLVSAELDRKVFLLDLMRASGTIRAAAGIPEEANSERAQAQGAGGDDAGAG